MEKYAILFSSKTGNTRILADAIRAALPEEDCAFFGEAGSVAEIPEVKTVYLGFWTDKGNADEAALNVLKNLRNKNVFLFGTAGFGVEDAYFQRVLNNVKASMDESNTLAGEFMCQGKMQQAVRDRYVKMKEQPDAAPNLDQMIDNFDRALSHPDEADLEHLRQEILK
ncbi:MAG: flavodoxin family protein [Mogibacterium sp.]|uniref:flavodoxin family protein BilS n=1 Tax=Mogibacterium sp. TaxID=2049035 RepID=UPI001A59E8A9|nr:flavodoxin family protein BilS [Mogibacterium sp.]MBL6468340.1 flavodoxin family protein [Mogibacterium sp.]